MREDFGDFGLENETRDLEPFYASVRLRAQGLDNTQARQRVLMELYEKFFATALKKEADRLGIVYTPVEVVDFILNSSDHVLREEFGRGLGDEDVHVLDPFTGTGIFLVRLIQSALIRDADLTRKYEKELHANEIVLLAYYIAAIHIEEAFHGRRGPESAYQPFEGIALTDTFNLNKGQGAFSAYWLPDNSERVERQQKTPIQVIVGNPPWSGKQRSSADDNPNVEYPELKQRVAATYAARSRATLKNSLYDTYKMAIRWASDRIGEQGIVALVTNGSWIDGNVDSGVRACLVEEFSAVYVLNLRGNQRTQGERSRREGGKIFGQGSRAPVAITILVRNPEAAHAGCRILYRDIGDYLKREKKLEILLKAESISGIKDWRKITPDRHHDWIGQRSEAFQKFYPMGTKDAKSGKTDDAIFKLFSNGYKTSRDAYIYNFSRDTCAAHARAMVGDYQGAMQVREARPDCTVDDAASHHSSHVRWDRELKNNLRRRKKVAYDPDKIWATSYRPFVKQHCYVEYVLVNNKYQMDSIFPACRQREPCDLCARRRLNQALFRPCSRLDARPLISPQRVASVSRATGIASRRTRSVLFPAMSRNWSGSTISPIGPCELFEYATRTTRLPKMRSSITFMVCYTLPPTARASPTICLRNCPVFPSRLISAPSPTAGHENLQEFISATRPVRSIRWSCTTIRSGEPRPEHFRIGTKKMKWADPDKTQLVVNEHIQLRDIPAAAHQYEVNGRTPIEWFIDRYYIKRDKRSGLVNDPNGWFEDPQDLVSAFRRIVQVSVDTVRIVADLPDPMTGEPNVQ